MDTMPLDRAPSLRSILNALPLPIFVLDEDFRVLAFNAAAEPFLTASPQAARGQRAGHALQCVNVTGRNATCGSTPACARCGLRNAMNSSMRAERVVHRRVTMKLVRRGLEIAQDFQVSVVPMTDGPAGRWLLVLQDRTPLVELEKLLPICPSCRSPRADAATRALAEAYLRRHWDDDFHACLCEDCLARLYQEHRPATASATGR